MTLKASERAGQVNEFWDNKAKPLPEWQRRIERYSGPSGDGSPSAEALDDRDRRAAMPETRNVTGIILGDPPNGRSALDRKKSFSEQHADTWPRRTSE